MLKSRREFIIPYRHDVSCAEMAQETFTSHSLVSGRFAASAAQQYHAPLPSLKAFETYIQQKICSKSDNACNSRTISLRQAAYLDFDYDAISQSLVLTAFYASSEMPGGWDERISKFDPAAKLEVGVLAPATPRQPEELSFGGFLINVGEDTNASMSSNKYLYSQASMLMFLMSEPTLFSFPSRHHPSLPQPNATYITSFAVPTGLHPTLRLRFPSLLSPPLPSCALHTYITLPSYIFPDKYQLASANLLATKNLHAIRSLAGETDLEAPDWVIQKWGSSMLLELAPPPRSESSDSAAWHADIPLHLRYLKPNEGGQRDMEVPWPVVFWACPAEEGTKMNTNPFDRKGLGYEGLFGPRTMFYHLTPQPAREPGSLIEVLQVPVLDVNHVEYVEVGTVIAILLGTLWLAGKLIRIFSYEPQWLVRRGIEQVQRKTKSA